MNAPSLDYKSVKMRPLKYYVCVSDDGDRLSWVMYRYSTELLGSYNRNIYNNIILSNTCFEIIT